MKHVLLLLLIVSAGQTGWSATKNFNPADCPPHCCYGKAGSETLESHCKTLTMECTMVCWLTERCAVIGRPGEFSDHEYPCLTLTIQLTGCLYIGTKADQFSGASCEIVDVECSCSTSNQNPCTLYPCFGAQHEAGCNAFHTSCRSTGRRI